MTSKKLQSIIDGDKEYLFQNYGDRLPVCFVRGEGSYLYDQDGAQYIDFFSGIAVSSLGYGNNAFSKALHRQVETILHSSNWYYNKEQVEAARLLSELSFPGKTLFVNSGTEASEAAIKLARRYGQSISPDCYGIISFEGSFHGRTFGAMSATAQERIHKGFGPIVPGFTYLPYNDIKSFKKEIGSRRNVCAVITELVQGEGGIKIIDGSFIREVATICAKHKILLIIDEVQTGIGRTGEVFAYRHFDITPDIITMAKGLGGGVPVGAMHARSDLSKYLEKGTHGTTFGGNHLASAAAVAVLKELKKPACMKKVKHSGAYIMDRMRALQKKTDIIQDVRGMGLHIGIELKKPGMDIVKRALDEKLIINCTAEKVIRIMPPLTIGMPVIKQGLSILEKILLQEVD